MNRTALYAVIDVELKQRAKEAALASKKTLWKWIEEAIREKLEKA